MRTPLVEPPLAGSEKELILGYLKFHQQVFLRKLELNSGTLLNEEQLQTPVAPTSMTLKGMASHLWFVEDYWRDWILLGQDEPQPWRSINWQADSDADWHIRLSIVEVLEGLRSAIQKTHNVLAEADWNELSMRANSDGHHFSIRWIAIHLIEEWSRHLGHADLLRENIDGAVGD